MTQKRGTFLTPKLRLREAPLAVGQIAVGRSTLH
jgi:hypothetical protein